MSVYFQMSVQWVSRCVHYTKWGMELDMGLLGLDSKERKYQPKRCFEFFTLKAT